MDIELKPRKIVLVFAVIVALLVVANILALVSEFAFGHDYVFGLIPLVALDEEQNIPTYFSSGLWFACALLSLAIAAAEKIEPPQLCLLGGARAHLSLHLR